MTKGLTLTQTLWSNGWHQARDAIARISVFLASGSCAFLLLLSPEWILGDNQLPLQSLAQVWLIGGVYATRLYRCCKSCRERKF